MPSRKTRRSTLVQTRAAEPNTVEQAEEQGGLPDVARGESSLEQPALGDALRRLRRERGLSLTQVAARTEISSSFLSLVEKGGSDIAIGRLMRVLRVYEAHVGDLVPDMRRNHNQIVVRRNEAQKFRSAAGVDLYLLAPNTDRMMMPVLTTFEPHARLTNLEPHGGETFIHILEGVILFELEGFDPIVLHPGDTVYYKPVRPPDFTNLGDLPARLLGAVTPPNL